MNPTDFTYHNISNDGDLHEECNTTLFLNDEEDNGEKDMIEKQHQQVCGHHVSKSGNRRCGNANIEDKCTEMYRTNDSKECAINGNSCHCESDKKHNPTEEMKENEQDAPEICKHGATSQGQPVVPRCCFHGVFLERPASTVKKKGCNGRLHNTRNEDPKWAHGTSVPICRKKEFGRNCMVTSTCSSHFCECEKESDEQIGAHWKGGKKRRRCNNGDFIPSSSCQHENVKDLPKRTKSTQTMSSGISEHNYSKTMKDQSTQTLSYGVSEHDYSKAMEDHCYSDMTVDSFEVIEKESGEYSLPRANTVEVFMDAGSSNEDNQAHNKCKISRANSVSVVDKHLQRVLQRSYNECTHPNEGGLDEDDVGATEECKSQHSCGHSRTSKTVRNCNSKTKNGCTCKSSTQLMQQAGHSRSTMINYTLLHESSDTDDGCNERHCRIRRANCNEIFCTSSHKMISKSSCHQDKRCSNDKSKANGSQNRRNAPSSKTLAQDGEKKLPQCVSCSKEVDTIKELNRIFPSGSSRNMEKQECRFDRFSVGNSRVRENDSNRRESDADSGMILKNAQNWLDSNLPSCENNHKSNDLPKSHAPSRPDMPKSNSGESPILSIFNKVQKFRCSVLHEKDPLSLDESSSSSTLTEFNDGSKRQTRIQKKAKPEDDDMDYDDDDDEADTEKNGSFLDPGRQAKILRKAIARKIQIYKTRRSRNKNGVSAEKQSKKKKQSLPIRLEMLLDMPPVPHEVQLNHSWNPDDSSTNMKVVEGNRLMCKRDPVAQSTDCIRCRVGYQHGIHLFEVSWPTKERGTHASIGVSTIEAPIHKEGYFSLVGDNEHSWGWELMKRITYHRAQNTRENDAEYPVKELQNNFAKLEFNAETVTTIPETFRMVLNMEEGTLGFMNGDLYLGHAFTGLKGKRLFPMVSAVWGHCEITLRYLGGIDAGPLSLMDTSRHQIRREIAKRLLTAQNLRRLGLPVTLQKFLFYG